MTNLLHRNNKLLQFTINVQKSHRQPQCSLQTLREDHVPFAWIDLHVSLRGQQQKASETCRALLQLLINILPSCITLVLYIYILTYDARKLKHKINFSSFITIHNVLVFVDSNSSVSQTMRNQTHIITNFSPHNYRHHHLPKCWPFHLNHSVFTYFNIYIYIYTHIYIYIHIYIYMSYWFLRDPVIHLVVCFTTGPKPLPKRALHIVRSRASSFKWG